MLIQAFAATTQYDQPLTSLRSIAQYRKLLEWAGQRMKFSTAFSPHSPRAGWATEQFLSHVPVATIKLKGRWASESSLKIYLDVLGAAYSLEGVASARPIASYLQEDFLQRFPWW